MHDDVKGGISSLMAVHTKCRNNQENRCLKYRNPPTYLIAHNRSDSITNTIIVLQM